MEKIEQPRSAFFDIFKAILIFCVVAGHGIETGIAGASMAASATYMFFYLFHMPAFIFLLGYFSKSTAASSRKILSRACFFLVMYVICKVVYYGGYKVVTGELPWWTAESFWAEDSPPWYMLTAALFMPTLWIARKIPGWIMVPVTFALGLVSGAIPGIGGMLCGSRTLIYLPMFLLGFYFPKNFFEKFLAKKRNWYWLATLAMGAVWILCWRYIYAAPSRYGEIMPILYANNSFEALGFDIKKGILVRAALYGTGIVMTAFAAMTAAALSWAKPGRLIEQAGRNTLVPYVVHYPIFLFCMKAVAKELTAATFILLVLIIVAFWSLDVWENALRYIQKGFYWFFGLFVKKKEEKVS